jgi:hypothetical protein
MDDAFEDGSNCAEAHIANPMKPQAKHPAWKRLLPRNDNLRDGVMGSE